MLDYYRFCVYSTCRKHVTMILYCYWTMEPIQNWLAHNRHSLHIFFRRKSIDKAFQRFVIIDSSLFDIMAHQYFWHMCHLSSLWSGAKKKGGKSIILRNGSSSVLSAQELLTRDNNNFRGIVRRKVKNNRIFDNWITQW